MKLKKKRADIGDQYLVEKSNWYYDFFLSIKILKIKKLIPYSLIKQNFNWEKILNLKFEILLKTTRNNLKLNGIVDIVNS